MGERGVVRTCRPHHSRLAALIADQLGHGNTAVTRRVYSHVYDRAAKANAIRAALSGTVAGGA